MTIFFSTANAAIVLLKKCKKNSLTAVKDDQDDDNVSVE